MCYADGTPSIERQRDPTFLLQINLDNNIHGVFTIIAFAARENF